MKTFLILVTAFLLELSALAQQTVREATADEVLAGTMGLPAVLTPRRGASFTLPYNQSTLLWPTNFLTANPALTNQVVIMHPNGSTVIYSNAANTDVGRGQTLLNAEEDASLVANDVFFLSAGRYAMNFNTLTNQGLAFGNIDLVSDGNFVSGSHMVGMGKNATIIDFTGSGTQGAFLGSYSSVRALTFTNVFGFTDNGRSTDLFATNQFAYFIDVGYTNQLAGAQDVWITGTTTHQNLWIQNCSMSFEYDVFASTVVNTTNVLVCENNNWYNNGNNIFPITRIQYGTMAATCYVVNDRIYCTGGTNYNIGIDNSDTGKTNSTLYVWNTQVNVAGPGQRSVWNGTFTNNKIFLGGGNVFDAGSAVPNQLALQLYSPATNTLTVPGAGVTNNSTVSYLLTITAGTALTLKDANGNQFLTPVLNNTIPFKPGWRLGGTSITAQAVQFP